MESHAPILHSDRSNSAAFTPEERAAQEIESALERCHARWAEIKAQIDRAPAVIEAEHVAENFTTVIAQLQSLKERVDRQHRDVKEPYLVAGRKVDSAANVLRELVVDAVVDLEQRLTDYHAAKEARIEAERAAIAAQEAEDPEPCYIPPAQQRRRRTRIRSVEGATAFLQDVIDMEILDIRAIPDRYLKRQRVLDALRAEILPDIKKGDEVEGVRRIETKRSQVRR